MTTTEQTQKAPDFLQQAMDDIHRGYGVDLKACEEGVWMELPKAGIELKIRHLTSKPVQAHWNSLDQSTQNRITGGDIDEGAGRKFMAEILGKSIVCGVRKAGKPESELTYNAAPVVAMFNNEENREARQRVWSFCQDNANYGLKDFIADSKNSNALSSST